MMSAAEPAQPGPLVASPGKITPGDTSNNFFPQKPKADQTPFVWFEPAQKSWADVFKIMQDVWKNEESRFSNLNTRGLGVVTASSIITTVLGFFSKDLFASSSEPLSGDLRFYAGVGTCVALLGLAVTAFIIVFGVLKPGGRFVLGNNELTGTYVGGQPNIGTEGKEENEAAAVASYEYAGMYVSLAERNRWKAYWLSWAYLVFVVSVTVSALVTAAIITFG